MIIFKTRFLIGWGFDHLPIWEYARDFQFGNIAKMHNLKLHQTTKRVYYEEEDEEEDGIMEASMLDNWRLEERPWTAFAWAMPTCRTKANWM